MIYLQRLNLTFTEYNKQFITHSYSTLKWIFRTWPTLRVGLIYIIPNIKFYEIKSKKFKFKTRFVKLIVIIFEKT